MRRGPLRGRDFCLLFYGQAISALGDRLVPVALAFAVLDLTGSVTDLGLVAAAQTAPLVIFVLLGGVWADRLPRQRVMLGSDVVRGLAQGISALLLLSGTAHIWQLAALQAVYGTAEAFFGPASTAVVPQTVGPSQLQRANALLSLSANVAAVLGPALAGVIVASIGSGWGLAIDAVTFAVSAAFLAAMRIAPAVPVPRASTLAELRAGLRSFRSRTWLWITVLFSALFLGFVFAPLLVLGPEVARTSLGGAGAWAAISTALGLGSLAGGVVGLRLCPSYPLRVSFIAFLIGGPALFLLLAAHAPLPSIVLAALIVGGAITFFTTLWYTALQREIPAAELSRVSSWDYLGSLALLPLGQALSGPVAEAIGVSTTLYVSAALFTLLVVAVLSVPAIRRFRLEPAVVAVAA